MSALAILPAGGDTATPRNLRKRVALIEHHAGPLAGRRVLDCGCGAGDYVRALLERGAEARGVEYSETKIREARALGDEAAGRVAVGDLEKLGFSAGEFDVALLNEVLEHVPDERAALREVHRVLRPGGRAIVFSPNRLYPFETHGARLRGSGRPLPHTVPLVPYVPLALGRRFLEYWARNYWPWELRALVRSCGFEIVGCDYVWQTFENISGHQPGWLRVASPMLRALSAALERTPLVRLFGVSQLVVARKR